MKNNRPWSFKIHAAEFFTAVDEIDPSEHSKFLVQFSKDLLTLSPKTEYGVKVIADTINFIEKQSKNGSLGGRPKKTQTKGMVISGLTQTEPKQKVKEKEKEKEIIEVKNKYADFVFMTAAEFDKLVSDHGETKTRWMIKTLDNYKGADPKKRKYSSDYRAILSWVVDKAAKEFTSFEPPKRGLVL